MMEKPEYNGESELDYPPIQESKGLLQLLKDSVAESVVVPTTFTKEDFAEICREWSEKRSKHEIWYFPISPEMNE